MIVTAGCSQSNLVQLIDSLASLHAWLPRLLFASPPSRPDLSLPLTVSPDPIRSAASAKSHPPPTITYSPTRSAASVKSRLNPQFLLSPSRISCQSSLCPVLRWNQIVLQTYNKLKILTGHSAKTPPQCEGCGKRRTV